MRLTDKPAQWWDDAAGYEIYVPSFADGNGDGMGDLLGVVDRLDYLAWLGIDVVWLTPFYVSPLADHGYDVADHCRIDPRFGDTEVFDALVDKAHRLGIRVIVDANRGRHTLRHDCRSNMCCVDRLVAARRRRVWR
jgi:alpha-glucosidase